MRKLFPNAEEGFIAIIIALLVMFFFIGLYDAYADEVCPTDDNGTDSIQCPQTYGDTPGLNRGQLLYLLQNPQKDERPPAKAPEEKEEKPITLKPEQKAEIQAIVNELLTHKITWTNKK